MKFKISKRWCAASAKKEEGHAVGAGLPSVLGLSKIKSPAKRVRSGRLVVLGLSSAKAFLRDMEFRAESHNGWRIEALRIGDVQSAQRNCAIMTELEYTAREFRRLTGLTKKRQPQHNVEISHDRNGEHTQ